MYRIIAHWPAIGGRRHKTAPPSHAGLYARVIPQAQVHHLPGRNHRLNDNLGEVTEAIRIGAPGPVTGT